MSGCPRRGSTSRRRRSTSRARRSPTRAIAPTALPRRTSANAETSARGRRFRRLAEERLAQRYRVVAPDLRGHGRSGHEPPWTIAAHLADIVETVAAAGVERAAWVGHSFGGRLILELAAREPERVE